MRLVLVFLIVLLLVLSFFPSFLTKHKPIESSNLLVEGWLTGNDIELLLGINYSFEKLDTIYISGVRLPYSDIAFTNEKLPFLFRSNASVKFRDTDNNDTTILEIVAKGTSFNERYPLLTISFEEETITNFYVTKDSKKYTIKIPNSTNKDIFLYYTNDASGRGEDRNLIVDSVFFNNESLGEISILPDYKIDFDKVSNFPFQSNAQKTANYLKQLFPDKYIVYTDTFQRKNKTMAAAENFGKHIKSSAPRSINIVSVHGHSRRSYIAYKAYLPNTQVGIISLDNRKYQRNRSWLRRMYHTADEYVSIAVTFFLVL